MSKHLILGVWINRTENTSGEHKLKLNIQNKTMTNLLIIHIK